MSALLGRFVPRLRLGWHPHIHLRGSGARCWGLCGPLSQGTALPPKQSRAVQREPLGGWGDRPSLLAAFPGPDSTQFCLIQLRQNVQGKGKAEGSILKQDKGRASQVTPARITSPRSAGRFKGFRTLERGRMWGSHLSLGAHFGVWYCANAHG